MTDIYFHPASLLHDPGPVPGMGPARLHAVLAALRDLPGLRLHQADPAPPEWLQAIHTPDYIADILLPLAPGEERAFDAETFAMQHTAAAALASAGQVVAAVRAAAAGQTRRAFCLASPGGHHAEAEMAQGFCFFNHVALAAVMAQNELGLKRVAVLDFDAHHGNGTQSLFWSCPDRLLVSLHEDSGLSGFAQETGACDNILNVPLAPGSDGAVFRAAMENQALPKIAEFAPDLLLLSAGFDMQRGDPLAHMALESKDYAWLGERLSRFATAYCHDRLVAVLEGGYRLDTLGRNVAAFVAGMA